MPDYELTTFQDGAEGEIMGLELAYQQQLRMLPAPFDRLGLMANVTLADSEGIYPTRPGEKLDFIGNSDTVGNLALTYERAGFVTRLALNYRSERLREAKHSGEIFTKISGSTAARSSTSPRVAVSRNGGRCLGNGRISPMSLSRSSSSHPMARLIGLVNSRSMIGQ